MTVPKSPPSISPTDRWHRLAPTGGLMRESVPAEVRSLVEALSQCQERFKECVLQVASYAELAELDATTPYDDALVATAAETLRDAIELIACLRRLLPLCTWEAIHEAFGAPGDFGYETVIGKALAELYAAHAGRVSEKAGRAREWNDEELIDEDPPAEPMELWYWFAPDELRTDTCPVRIRATVCCERGKPRGDAGHVIGPRHFATEREAWEQLRQDALEELESTQHPLEQAFENQTYALECWTKIEAAYTRSLADNAGKAGEP